MSGVRRAEARGHVRPRAAWVAQGRMPQGRMWDRACDGYFSSCTGIGVSSFSSMKPSHT